MKRYVQKVIGLIMVYLIWGGSSALAQPVWDYVFNEGSISTEVGENGNSVVVDPYGDYYVVGSFDGLLTNFTGTGGTPIVWNTWGNLDIFVAKYDWAGNIVWVASVGGPNLDSGVDIAYDAFNDQVVVIGNVQGDVNSQVNVSTWQGNFLIDVVDNTGNDIAIVLFDASDGSFYDDWEVIGGSNNDFAGGVVADPFNGDFYVTGSFIGIPGFDAYFGTDAGLIDRYLESTFDGFSAYSQDAFVAAFDQNGVSLWAYQIGGMAEDRGKDIAILPNVGGSTVAITGSYEDQFIYSDIDGIWQPTGEGSTNGGKDVYGIGYNSDGSANWFNFGGSINDDEGTAIAYSKSGEVYITGYIAGSADFDGIVVGDILNTTDVFIGKSIGQDWQWVSTGGGLTIDQAWDITLTPDQQPVIIGTIEGTVDFGGLTLPLTTVANSKDIFVAKYDPWTGEAIELGSGGGSGIDKGRGLASSGDQLIVTGSIKSTDATYGVLSLASSSGTLAADIFIGALDGFGPFQEFGGAFNDIFKSTVAPGDIDGDGDLDILYFGDNFGIYQTYIYQNDITSFVNIGQATIPGMGEGDADWGDYDGDGDLDLVISGWNSGSGMIYTSIYRNDGGFVFTDIAAPLTKVFGSTSDWGDYDNDGDLDLLIAGYTGSSTTTNIYRNDGGSFVNINAGLEGYNVAALDWGDYDNDGDLDFFIAGYTGIADKSVIYRNDGSDTFTELNVLPGLENGDGEWGDYDNDGDLDIALTGWDQMAVMYVMRNNGDGTFTDAQVGLTGLWSGPSSDAGYYWGGSLDWGDFDGDGDIDLLMSGWDDFNAITYIGENLGDGTFREIDLGIVGVQNGDARWADFDNDGLLDIFVTGEDEGAFVNAILYKNYGAYNQNSTPSIPANPTISKNGTQVTFSWDTAIDDLTPNDGLSYNLRIGTSPGSSEIMAPNSINPTSGTRLVPDKGNVGPNKSWTINLPPEGTYYWGVQSIDGGFIGSGFSAPQGFNVENSNPVIFEPIVRLIPANAKAGEPAKLVYDATQGDGNLVGAPRVYLYSGVVVTDPADITWSNIIGNWGVDDGIGEMTLVAGQTDLWEIDLTPTIQEYYSVATGTTIHRLAMVFNNPDGTIKGAGGGAYKFPGGESTGNGDIFIELSDNGTLGSDYYALLDLYNTLDGPNWTDKTNWFDPDMNTWFGVTVTNNRVTSIDLKSNNLIGAIPASIANLTSLDSLILQNNAITGQLGPEIASMTNLKKIDLKINQFAGPIPPEIGNITGLEFLSLRNNLLDGALPTEIGNLTNLAILSLGNNAFSGPLPGSVNQLTKLTFLSVSNNQLTDSLPDLSALTSLESFYTWNNNFVGDIPDYFTGFSKLASVSIENNSFGNFPDLSGLPLTTLWMDGNLFSFEDVLPNVRTYSDTLVYYPQDTLGIVDTVLVPQGKEYRLNFGIDKSVAGNVYKWYFNGVEVTGQTDSVFIIADFQADSAGAFYGEITNPGAPGLTLVTRPTYLFIDPSADVIAPVISNINAPANYLLGTGGNGLEVSATFTDNVGITKVAIGFAPISAVTNNIDETQYTIVTLDTINLLSGIFGYTIPESAFGPIGVQYFFAADDAAGNTGFSDPRLNYTYTVKADNASSLSNVLVPVVNNDDPAVSDFRMFSVPVESATIGSVFDISSLDNEKIRIFHYNGSNALELTSTGSSIELGKGYWLIYLSDAGLDLGFGGESPNVNNLNLFTMPLTSGWNQIGNPYPFPISWQRVIAFNVTKGNIPANGISGFFSYGAGGFKDEGAGDIKMNQGVFIKSNEPFTIEIPLIANASNARTGANARVAKSPLDAEEWRVPIDIENDITGYQVASIGMKPDANNGIDYYDIAPLPYLDDFLEFNSVSEEGKFSQDYVKSSDGYVWNYEAATSLPPGRTKLTWENDYFGDNDLQLVLYDVEGDRIINMRESAKYTFTLNQKRPFRIYYGDDDFIKAHLKPAEISLGKAYPNPFTNEINIPFTLPDNSKEYGIEANIYNAMGQAVKVLADESMSYGFYALKWDGTNESGQVMPEGIYYYKLKVTFPGNTREFSGKMIFRK